MRIFMTGGTGLVGSALAEALVADGHRVVILSRAMRRGPEGLEFVGGRSTAPGPWAERLAGCDAVVHLAGEPIARLAWTELHERAVVSSRVDGTRALVAALADLPEGTRPRVLLSASTADRYRFADGDDAHGEEAPAGEHFFGRLAAAWEAEALAARALGMRVVVFRHGLVLGRGAHGYRHIDSAAKILHRGPCGSGEQWLPWVHLDDVVAAYRFALDAAALDGPANLVAPGAIRQGDFARAVCRVLEREPWSGINVGRARARLGPYTDVLLGGRRVVPRALEQAGFRFHRADLPAALAASLDEKVEREVRRL
jgi:uncharacterized protein (TIGR01777 family)